MKKTFAILLACFLAAAVFGLGGVGRFQNCYEVVPAGTFIPTTSFASNWVTENGATASFTSATQATFTGRANTSDLTTYSNWITQSENWLMTWTETAPTINSTAYGVGGGVRSIFNTTLAAASYQRSYYGQLFYTTANLGKLYIYQWYGGSSTAEAISSSGMSITAGDTLLRGFGRETNLYYTWAVDTRTSASNFVSWNFILSAYPGTSPLPADGLIGRFGFWIVGGAVTVKNFSVTSTLNTPIFLLDTGASIDVGFSATNYQARWMGVVQSNCFYPCRVCAASYSIGTNFINTEQEYAFLHPMNIIMPDIGNNIIFGLTNTMTNDFTNFAAWATVTNGSSIIVKTPTPHGTSVVSGYDETVAYAFITNYYPHCVNLWTPMLGSAASLNSAYDDGEHQHPNPLGHYVIGTNILNALCNPPFTTYAFPTQ
jgi:hypothetical protein